MWVSELLALIALVYVVVSQQMQVRSLRAQLEQERQWRSGAEAPWAKKQ